MKKILKLFLTGLLTSFLCYVGAVSVFAVEIEGLGTKASPYIIKNEEQLLALATKELSLSAYYKLDNDIKLITKSWTPIGANASDGFTGNFDGNGHKIANLNIGDSTNSYGKLGLFSTNNGTISNLTVVAGSISANGSKNIGVITGVNKGTISNCFVSGNIYASVNSRSDSNYVGGIAGGSSGVIKDCDSIIEIDERSSIYYVGGIAGKSSAEISNCKFYGVMSGFSSDYVGGVVGSSTGGITKCGNLADININEGNYVGGVVGCSSNETVSLCYNKASLNVTDTTYSDADGDCGGLIGYVSDTLVENCFSIGNVVVEKDRYYVGGLIGENDNSSSKYIKNCYCIGTVTGSNSRYKDAFANGSSKSYTNCFYNKTKESTVSSSVAYGLTDTEMKDVSAKAENYTFWDFKDIWGMNETINNGYPYLLSMITPVTGITLSETSVKLINGDTKKLTATVLPETATNKNYTWSSSDENIVSVDSDGTITAKGIGEAVITAKTAEGEFSAQCAVNVVTEDEVEETAIFRIDNLSTIAGQRISVPLMLTKNTAGISTLGIDITYDNSVLTPVSVNTDTCELFNDIVSNTNYSSDTIRITTSSAKNKVGSGVVCYIEFDVSNTAAAGTSNIKINVRELKTLNGTTQKDLAYIVYDGKLTVEDCILGDVNGDGQITATDATEVLLNYAGLKEFSIKESTAADVDKSESITANDATMILLKYAGYDTEW